MPDIDEGLIFDGLDLNNTGGPFVTEAIAFKPAQKKLQWADNPDADGDALVDEAHYTNAYFEGWRIRIDPQASMDEALARLAELTDKLQKAERMAAAGGIPLEWTPANSTKTWTWYALVGEYDQVPVEPTGELAGWFLSSPIVTIKVTARSFGYGKEKQVLAPVSSTLPLQTAILEDPGGDVPAEARIQITDEAGQDRRLAELGLEQLDEAKSPPALLIDSDSMIVTGLAGAQATREGAYDPNGSGNNVIRCTAISTPVVACSTGPITNIGAFRLKPRIYALSEDVRIRASYKVGDGPFESLPWQRPVLINAWSEIEVGEATLDRLLKGTQKSEIRFEVKSVGSKTEVDFDYLQMFPTTKGYAKVRGLASEGLTNLLAYDEADQPAGNLTGGYTTNGITAITAASPGVITCTAHGLSNGDKVWIEGIEGTMGEVLTGLFTVAGVATNTFNVGVNTTGKTYKAGGKVSKAGKTLPFPNTVPWYGIGDPDDAALNATAHTFERTAVSDSAIGSGRFLLVGAPSALGAVRVGIDITASASSAVGESFRRGPFARFRDASNWLMVPLVSTTGHHSRLEFTVLKCVAGVITTLKISQSPLTLGTMPRYLGILETTPRRVELQVDETGVVQVWIGDPTSTLEWFGSGQSADLATGGALATGRCGFYDSWTSATACTRTFDNLVVMAPADAGRVCYANRVAEARPDEDWLREDADGGDWGAPSIYRGANFYLPPAGGTPAVNRLAVKLRRNDTDTEADPYIADKSKLAVWATPRVLLPR